MKKNPYVLAVTAIALIAVVTSCKKDSGSNNNPGGQSGSLVRIQQGVSVDDDTVYLIRYDGQKRVSAIIDSINLDTLTAAYNSSNQLTDIQETSPYGHDHLSATYNGSGQLTELNSSFFGQKDKYVFEYSGSMPSKKSYYTDAGQGGSVALYRYYTYTLTGTNITGIKEYSAGDVFLGERKITYGTQTNPFKGLTLFNWGNRLGIEDIITQETFFNTNMATNTAWYDDSNNMAYSTAVTPANNSSNIPTGITAAEKYADGELQNLFTWSFSYK